MTRRELRTYTFKLLFRALFHSGEDMKEQEALFFDSPEVELDVYDTEYVQNKVNEIISRIPEIDKAIDSKAEGWKVNRMNYVDLTLIRLAYYEMKHRRMCLRRLPLMKRWNWRKYTVVMNRHRL